MWKSTNQSQGVRYCKMCKTTPLDEYTIYSLELCGWCEKKYYDYMYIIHDYKEAKGRK